MVCERVTHSAAKFIDCRAKVDTCIAPVKKGMAVSPRKWRPSEPSPRRENERVVKQPEGDKCFQRNGVNGNKSGD